MTSGEANWDKLWRASFTYGPLDGWAREIFLTIGQLLKDIDAPSILSAGCGRALVDYWLLEALGLRVTLLDKSEQCIKNLKRALRSVKGRCEIVHGSILDIPYPDRSFDLVWNEGVLEHFNEADYHQSLREMVRVTQRFVLIDVPNANCRPYVLVKEWLEAHDRWSWGYEQPRASLRQDLADIDVRVLSEQSIGGKKTIMNYLEMIPNEHRQDILTQLKPEDFNTFPYLLTVGALDV
jgi:ubiquinone/menaquinone biosynthesis C-methylase UbiE